MPKIHQYKAAVTWTGNLGEGTSAYKTYSRNHLISIAGKPDLAGSSDAAFRGDAARHNPEDLLLASLASCHMLWYLHLCTDHGIVVMAYEDNATGTMEENENGGRFTEVILKPRVTISDKSKTALALELHALAHKKCFIANSVNFPVKHNPTCA